MSAAVITQAGRHVSRRARTYWWRAFPGEPACLRVLRRWVEDLLLPCPERDDVIEVACELAGNAICHTRSGQGGKFGVRIEQNPGLITVTVADRGSPSGPRLVEDPLAEHGRGLRIVYALSARVTVTGGEAGRLVRAEVPWTADSQTPARPAERGPVGSAGPGPPRPGRATPATRRDTFS